MLGVITKQILVMSIRCLATRKDGMLRKGPRLPRLPIKGPRDFDYWRGLKRKPKKPKDKITKVNRFKHRKPEIRKPKEKREMPTEEDEEAAKKST